MKLKYYILETFLAQTTRYLGRLVLNGTYDREALVKRMLQIGTSVPPQDIHSVLQLFQVAVLQLCAEGHTVHLDQFLRFRPTLGGSFTNLADTFTRPRNSVSLTVALPRRLNARFQAEVQVQKVCQRERRPLIIKVSDWASQTHNHQVTPLGLVALKGIDLKFDPNDPASGLFWISATGPQPPLPIVTLHRLTQREVICSLPELPLAPGYFEIRQGNGRGHSRIIRSDTVLVRAGVNSAAAVGL